MQRKQAAVVLCGLFVALGSLWAKDLVDSVNKSSGVDVQKMWEKGVHDRIRTGGANWPRLHK